MISPQWKTVDVITRFKESAEISVRTGQNLFYFLAVSFIKNVSGNPSIKPMNERCTKNLCFAKSKISNILKNVLLYVHLKSNLKNALLASAFLRDSYILACMQREKKYN